MLLGYGLKMGHRRSGASAPAYNPATEPGAVLFYEADHPSNQLNAGAFSQLTDLTGNGRHATQATGSNQAARIASGMNGRAIARCDTNDYFDITTVALPNALAYTLYFVFQNAPTTAFKYLFDQVSPRFLVGQTAANANRIGIYDGAFADNVAGAANVPTTAAQVLAFEFDGLGACRIFRDGSQLPVTLPTTPRALFGGATPTTSVLFCDSTNKAQSFFNGDFASGFFVTSTRSAHNATAIDSYFRTKWGTP